MSGTVLDSKVSDRKRTEESASDPPHTLDERLKSNDLPIQKEPSCIISTKDGVLHIDEDVLEQLKSIKGKIVVVAIAGIYRTGKSYLMNRLAGKSAGFALGAEIESVTKGIWIWVRPHPLRPNVNLVLMDTEGLADPDKGDPEHDNWIFILATVLSSVLVYNVMGVINEDVITKINYITEMSKRLRVLQSEEEDEGEVIQGYFPTFIMAVRDFSLTLVRQGKKISSDEYFEGLLISKSSQEYNAPRDCIKKYFHRRKCFTFDRPATKRKLAMLEELSDEQLSEDFLDDTTHFTTFVYNECQPKTTLNATPMSCYTLALLITNYVKSIRAGEIPCVKSTLHFVIEEANEKAIESAICVYRDEMDKVDLPTENENRTLSLANTEAVKLALRTFYDNKFEDAHGTFQIKLLDRTSAIYHEYLKKDKTASIKACEAAIEELGTFVREKLVKCVYVKSGGFVDYKADMWLLRRRYMQASGLGFMREICWSKFMNEKRSEFQQVQITDMRITHLEKLHEDRLKAKEDERQKADIELKLTKEGRAEMKKEYEEFIKLLHSDYREDIAKLFAQVGEEQRVLLEEVFDRLSKKTKENENED